jgi:hypothetical protein
MTPEQVKSIQESFAKVAPIADTAAALFYNRLFDIAPDVKPLFRGDMTEQGRKLMKILTVVVNGRGNLQTILPAASALERSRGVGGEALALHAGRRSLAVDTAARAGIRLDARARRRVERGLRDAFELHDCRSLRPPSSGRMSC